MLELLWTYICFGDLPGRAIDLWRPSNSGNRLSRCSLPIIEHSHSRLAVDFNVQWKFCSRSVIVGLEVWDWRMQADVP